MTDQRKVELEVARSTMLCIYN